MSSNKFLARCFLCFGVFGSFSAPYVRASPPDSPVPNPKNPTITLAVDAFDAPRKVLHAALSIPARPGPLTLVYPKWIPGEHGPTGPIDDVTGLVLTAAGKRLEWKRDLTDMYAFHCVVPPGASKVDIKLDFLLSSNLDGFSSSGLTTPNLVNINWNQLLLYPAGKTADGVNVTASLKLPAGWKLGTALPVAQTTGETTAFQTVPLVTLIDSPVLAGAYFTVVPLTIPGVSPALEIDMASDSADALAMSETQKTAYKQLVSEASALFGAQHFRGYHFLYTLSDHVASFGLEHHESSDDRVGERDLLDEPRKGSGDLLPHEFVHSWNGKYRRPAGLSTPDYQTPMRTDMLWLYEGLTQYYGKVLTARCGLWNQEDFQKDVARLAANLDHEPGRTWRPLADTADAAQLLYNSPEEARSARRGTDFYDEMVLVWLEADSLIRQKTDNKRSLDDFCRAFYGGASGPPAVKTYTFDDVVAALNAVAPSDWRGFLQTRLRALSPRAPLGGLTASGWKLSYEVGEKMPVTADATGKEGNVKDSDDKEARTEDLRYSIGLKIGDDGQISDAVAGMPGADAGLAPGMKIIAVNGRRFSMTNLKTLVKNSKTRTAPLEFIVENGEFFQTLKLTYRGGAQSPHLERDPAKPDLLTEILKPRALSGSPH